MLLVNKKETKMRVAKALSKSMQYISEMPCFLRLETLLFIGDSGAGNLHACIRGWDI